MLTSVALWYTLKNVDTLFFMTTKLSKEDQKWILFNQKMARMSGKKKTSKDFLDAIKQSHDEVYNNEDQQ